MKKEWFTVIIPIYNVDSFLPPCLNSVFKSSYKKFQVIVVDDNSTDNSVSIIKKLKKKHKNLVLLQNSRNLGPSESRNKALAKADTEYIYFLDSDTEVTPHFLSEVYKVFKTNPDAGAVQSLLCDFERRKTIQNAGLKLIRETGWAVGLQEGEDIRKAPKEATQIIGLSAALAIKREVFEKGITFDKAFFHYSEDLDFSWRIWIAGYKIYLSPKSVVYHMVKKMEARKNVGANNRRVTFHLAKNSMRSLTKNYELTNFLLYFPQCVAVLLGRALLVLIVRGDSSSLFGTLEAFVWYLVHLPDTLTERTKLNSIVRKAHDSSFFDIIMVKEGLLTVYKKHFAQTRLLPL